MASVSTYNLTVTHRAGRKHGNAYTLSRRPCQAYLHQQKINEETLCSNINQTLPEPEGSTDHIVSAITRKQARRQAKKHLTRNQCLLDGWDPTFIGQGQIEDSKIGLIYIAKKDGKTRPEWTSLS